MSVQMGKKPVRIMLIIAAVVLLAILAMQPLEVLRLGESVSFLYPDGIIAIKQRDLLFVLQILMLIVIIPVYILTFAFSWHYRADNTKAKYDPDLVDNKLAEVIWWGVPLVMTIFASYLTWIKTHELDPYKPIASDKEAITIQVVALQWKWLFIYPEHDIATVNFIQFPKDTPLHFLITADAPMNSFWIPNLGGQIYAMPSMQTELYLIADKTGDYRGSSANISGEGFAGMTFTARASTDEEYHQWVAAAKNQPNQLNYADYVELAKPSQNHAPEVYQLKSKDLFDQIMMKYMHPTKE